MANKNKFILTTNNEEIAIKPTVLSNIKISEPTLHIGTNASFMLNDDENSKLRLTPSNKGVIANNVELKFYWPQLENHDKSAMVLVNANGPIERNHYYTYDKSLISTSAGSTDYCGSIVADVTFEDKNEDGIYDEDSEDLQNVASTFNGDLYSNSHAITNNFNVDTIESHSPWKFDHWEQFSKDENGAYLLKPVFVLDEVMVTYYIGGASSPGIQTGYSSDNFIESTTERARDLNEDIEGKSNARELLSSEYIENNILWPIVDDNGTEYNSIDDLKNTFGIEKIESPLYAVNNLGVSDEEAGLMDNEGNEKISLTNNNTAFEGIAIVESGSLQHSVWEDAMPMVKVEVEVKNTEYKVIATPIQTKDNNGNTVWYWKYEETVPVKETFKINGNSHKEVVYEIPEESLAHFETPTYYVDELLPYIEDGETSLSESAYRRSIQLFNENESHISNGIKNLRHENLTLERKVSDAVEIQISEGENIDENTIFRTDEHIIKKLIEHEQLKEMSPDQSTLLPRNFTTLFNFVDPFRISEDENHEFKRSLHTYNELLEFNNKLLHTDEGQLLMSAGWMPYDPIKDFPLSLDSDGNYMYDKGGYQTRNIFCNNLHIAKNSIYEKGYLESNVGYDIHFKVVRHYYKIFDQKKTKPLSQFNCCYNAGSHYSYSRGSSYEGLLSTNKIKEISIEENDAVISKDIYANHEYDNGYEILNYALDGGKEYETKYYCGPNQINLSNFYIGCVNYIREVNYPEMVKTVDEEVCSYNSVYYKLTSQGVHYNGNSEYEKHFDGNGIIYLQELKDFSLGTITYRVIDDLKPCILTTLKQSDQSLIEGAIGYLDYIVFPEPTHENLSNAENFDGNIWYFPTKMGKLSGGGCYWNLSGYRIGTTTRFYDNSPYYLSKANNSISEENGYTILKQHKVITTKKIQEYSFRDESHLYPVEYGKSLYNKGEPLDFVLQHRDSYYENFTNLIDDEEVYYDDGEFGKVLYQSMTDENRYILNWPALYGDDEKSKKNYYDTYDGKDHNAGKYFICDISRNNSNTSSQNPSYTIRDYYNNNKKYLKYTTLDKYDKSTDISYDYNYLSDHTNKVDFVEKNQNNRTMSFIKEPIATKKQKIDWEYVIGLQKFYNFMLFKSGNSDINNYGGQIKRIIFRIKDPTKIKLSDVTLKSYKNLYNNGLIEILFNSNNLSDYINFQKRYKNVMFIEKNYFENVAIDHVKINYDENNYDNIVSISAKKKYNLSINIEFKDNIEKEQDIVEDYNENKDVEGTLSNYFKKLYDEMRERNVLNYLDESAYKDSGSSISVEYIPPIEEQYKTAWNDGITSLAGNYIWKDKNYVIHYDKMNNHYVFDDAISQWQKISWNNNGFTSIQGADVWSDKYGNTYCSDIMNGNFKLNEKTLTWSAHSWSGSLTQIYGTSIWHDAEKNTYYDDGVQHFKLNEDKNSWTTINWVGLEELGQFDGAFIWHDKNNNCYFSKGQNHFKLENDGITWTRKTFNGGPNYFDGTCIWNDADGNAYYSDNNEQFKFDEDSYTWTELKWEGFSSLEGYLVWHDNNKNIYCTGGNKKYQYALTKIEDIIEDHLLTEKYLVHVESEIEYFNKIKDILKNNGLNIDEGNGTEWKLITALRDEEPFLTETDIFNGDDTVYGKMANYKQSKGSYETSTTKTVYDVPFKIKKASNGKLYTYNSNNGQEQAAGHLTAKATEGYASKKLENLISDCENAKAIGNAPYIKFIDENSQTNIIPYDEFFKNYSLVDDTLSTKYYDTVAGNIRYTYSKQINTKDECNFYYGLKARSHIYLCKLLSDDAQELFNDNLYEISNNVLDDAIAANKIEILDDTTTKYDIILGEELNSNSSIKTPKMLELIENVNAEKAKYSHTEWKAITDTYNHIFTGTGYTSLDIAANNGVVFDIGNINGGGFKKSEFDRTLYVDEIILNDDGTPAYFYEEDENGAYEVHFDEKITKTYKCEGSNNYTGFKYTTGENGGVTKEQFETGEYSIKTLALKDNEKFYNLKEFLGEEEYHDKIENYGSYEYTKNILFTALENHEKLKLEEKETLFPKEFATVFNFVDPYRTDNYKLSKHTYQELLDYNERLSKDDEKLKEGWEPLSIKDFSFNIMSNDNGTFGLRLNEHQTGRDWTKLSAEDFVLLGDVVPEWRDPTFNVSYRRIFKTTLKDVTKKFSIKLNVKRHYYRLQDGIEKDPLRKTFSSTYDAIDVFNNYKSLLENNSLKEVFFEDVKYNNIDSGGSYQSLKYYDDGNNEIQYTVLKNAALYNFKNKIYNDVQDSREQVNETIEYIEGINSTPYSYQYHENGYSYTERNGIFRLSNAIWDDNNSDKPIGLSELVLTSPVCLQEKYMKVGNIIVPGEKYNLSVYSSNANNDSSLLFYSVDKNYTVKEQSFNSTGSKISSFDNKPWVFQRTNGSYPCTVDTNVAYSRKLFDENFKNLAYSTHEVNDNCFFEKDEFIKNFYLTTTDDRDDCNLKTGKLYPPSYYGINPKSAIETQLDYDLSPIYSGGVGYSSNKYYYSGMTDSTVTSRKNSSNKMSTRLRWFNYDKYYRSGTSINDRYDFGFINDKENNVMHKSYDGIVKFTYGYPDNYLCEYNIKTDSLKCGLSQNNSWRDTFIAFKVKNKNLSVKDVHYYNIYELIENNDIEVLSKNENANYTSYLYSAQPAMTWNPIFTIDDYYNYPNFMLKINKLRKNLNYYTELGLNSFNRKTIFDFGELTSDVVDQNDTSREIQEVEDFNKNKDVKGTLSYALNNNVIYGASSTTNNIYDVVKSLIEGVNQNAKLSSISRTIEPKDYEHIVLYESVKEKDETTDEIKNTIYEHKLYGNDTFCLKNKHDVKLIEEYGSKLKGCKNVLILENLRTSDVRLNSYDDECNFKLSKTTDNSKWSYAVFSNAYPSLINFNENGIPDENGNINIGAISDYKYSYKTNKTTYSNYKNPLFKEDLVETNSSLIDKSNFDNVMNKCNNDGIKIFIYAKDEDGNDKKIYNLDEFVEKYELKDDGYYKALNFVYDYRYGQQAAYLENDISLNKYLYCDANLLFYKVINENEITLNLDNIYEDADLIRSLAENGDIEIVYEEKLYDYQFNGLRCNYNYFTKEKNVELYDELKDTSSLLLNFSYFVDNYDGDKNGWPFNTLLEKYGKHSTQSNNYIIIDTDNITTDLRKKFRDNEFGIKYNIKDDGSKSDSSYIRSFIDANSYNEFNQKIRPQLKDKIEDGDLKYIVLSIDDDNFKKNN